MTWLVVTGSTPFAFANSKRQMVNIQPGVYEDVSDEVVYFARRSNKPSVILGEDDVPEIIRQPALHEPLQLKHLRIPLAGTVTLAAPAVIAELNATFPTPRGSDPYPCSYNGCSRRFPSRGSLDWHREWDHLGEDDPEPPPDPPATDAEWEPALTES